MTEIRVCYLFIYLFIYFVAVLFFFSLKYDTIEDCLKTFGGKIHYFIRYFLMLECGHQEFLFLGNILIIGFSQCIKRMVHVFRGRSLSGVFLKVYCKFTYTCSHYTLKKHHMQPTSTQRPLYRRSL